MAIALKENEELKKLNDENLKSLCDELKQANKIIKKLHDSNQEQTQKVGKFLIIWVELVLLFCFQLMLSKDIALKQKEDIHKYQTENAQLSKSLEEKISSMASINIELLETKNQLLSVEKNLKEKEERLASNDKGNFLWYKLYGLSRHCTRIFCFYLSNQQ